MGWKHKEDRLAKPDGGYVCRTYSWLGVTSFFPCCFWIFKSSIFEDTSPQITPIRIAGQKGGGLWGYYHTTFNRERQVMQFAKAGDDCEPKSLKAREDGTLDDGEADFCRIQWSTRYTLW